MTARRRLSVRLVVITGVSAVTAGVTVTVRVITASGGALLPLAGPGTGGRAGIGRTEELLPEGEDGDEAGDLVHLHAVAGAPVTEGRVEDLFLLLEAGVVQTLVLVGVAVPPLLGKNGVDGVLRLLGRNLSLPLDRGLVLSGFRVHVVDELVFLLLDHGLPGAAGVVGQLGAHQCGAAAVGRMEGGAGEAILERYAGLTIFTEVSRITVTIRFINEALIIS